MWHRSLLLCIGLLLSAAGFCANVETDYDTNADFSELHYYQWQDETGNIDDAYTALPSDRVKFAVEQALDRQFAAGSEQHKADFLVRYYIRTVKKLVDDRSHVGVGIGGFGGSGGGGVGGGISFSFPLGGDNLDQQAHVVIDLLNTKNHQLLWRGSTVTGLSSTAPQVNEKQIQKAADAILKQFPPRN